MLAAARLLKGLAAQSCGPTALSVLAPHLGSLASNTCPSSSATQPTRDFSSVQNPPYVPWTPSRLLKKRKEYKKRMHFLVQELEKENVEKMQQLRQYPNFRSGDILEVRMLVPENQRQEYIVKGLCIARHNKAFRTTFTLYNVFPDVGGVVQHFPLYMPDILEIKVVGKVKTNKSKMYHMLTKETLNYSYQSDAIVAQ